MNRRKFLRGLCCLLFTLGWAHTTSAETYYVAPDGQNSGPGTEAQPWRSIQYAADRMNPGDTVRIRAGNYYVGQGLYLRRAGTAEAPIVYRAHGDGPVRITNSTVVPGPWTKVNGDIYSATVPKGTQCAFDGDEPLTPPGSHGFKGDTIEEVAPGSFLVKEQTLYVRLAGGADPSARKIRAAPYHAISFYENHYNVFDGLTVEYTYNAFKRQRDTTHHITIRNCTIRCIRSQGIQPVAKDCIIEHNLFQKIGTTKFLHGIYCGTSNTIIRHNVFEEVAGAAIHLYPTGGQSEVYGNVFRKPRKMANGGYYGEIVAWGDGGHKIYNNVLLGGGVRYGISANSNKNEIYHNTFVGCPRAIYLHEGKNGNRVQGNIIVEGRIEDHGHGSVISNNMQADPGFLNAAAGDFRLRPGRPAIDAGVRIPLVRSDFAGTPRPTGNAPDLGAFEFVKSRKEQKQSDRPVGTGPTSTGPEQSTERATKCH